MADPTRDPHQPTGNLVRAPDEVITGVAQRVRSQDPPRRRPIQTGIWAFVFSWPPAFLVFAAVTIVAPSVTNQAGVGATAWWALLFAVLTGVTAVVESWWRPPLSPPSETPDPAGVDRSVSGIVLRVAIRALITAACAGVVLALHGLALHQIAVLAVALIVVLHLLPMAAARLLRRRRRG